ncbi:hypothetical protein MYX65_01930 [Acidobacteria bacterium AH-259-L09]|nr:hypothetical protein [Acidobacteria bacterium AH-259-L09]
MASLEIAFQKTIQLLESSEIPYFVLGGLAVGVLGEPRFTYDVDLDIQLSKDEVPSLLAKAQKVGFTVDLNQAQQDVASFGTFRMCYEQVVIDCILASTPLEEQVLKRRQKRPLFEIDTYLPTPEDLILLKIIPGRPKDLVDAESIVLRHGTNLNRAYLEDWAKRICEEAEDFRIWRTLQDLLKKI